MAAVHRPNVLVVLTDQQRWDTLGAYGNPMDLTPNLDAMAERGTHVEQAFTPQPLCGPARACIQTGQYASSHGVWGNYQIPEAEHMLGDLFVEAGYRTGYVGKWHIGTEDSTAVGRVPEDDRGGYEYWRASQTIEHTSHPYEGVVFDETGERIEFDGYRVDALTDLAIEFIEGAAADDQPFFCFLSVPEPHHQNDMGAFVAPEGYATRYAEPHVPPDLLGRPGDWQEALPAYYGICARIDECVGRLRSTLEAHDIADETIVVFTSDHGCTFRTRPGTYKRSPHESSIRVPMLLDGPGFTGNARIDALASLLDLPPTVLEGAGIRIPDAMAGRSLLGGIDSKHRDGVFIQSSAGARSSRTLRTGRWKYAVTAAPVEDDEYVRDEYTEWCFYDLAADPWEQTNLAGRSEYRATASHLRTHLRDYIERVEGVSPVVRTREAPP